MSVAKITKYYFYIVVAHNKITIKYIEYILYSNDIIYVYYISNLVLNINSNLQIALYLFIHL